MKLSLAIMAMFALTFSISLPADTAAIKKRGLNARGIILNKRAPQQVNPAGNCDNGAGGAGAGKGAGTPVAAGTGNGVLTPGVGGAVGAAGGAGAAGVGIAGAGTTGAGAAGAGTGNLKAADNQGTGQNANNAATGTAKAAKSANDASFCNGKTATNGLQVKEGSCSTTVQGQIPSADRMVSTLILEPKNGAKLPANTAFNILVRTRNMALGKFDDPKTAFYLTPQQVNAAGIIEGHQHVTIQQMTSVNQQDTLDPATFAFFKGLDQPPSGDLLNTTSDPLTAGVYRMCTLTGTFGHQPVIMPVAQRGAQDDCIRFEMV